MSDVLRIAPEVAGALDRGRPVVALESTLIAHGLPRGRNLEVAHELEDVVRAAGAVPATIAVVDGVRAHRPGRRCARGAGARRRLHEGRACATWRR